MQTDEAARLAKVYRLILSWTDPNETASSEDLGGEALEAGRLVSSKNDDFCILPQREEMLIDDMKKERAAAKRN